MVDFWTHVYSLFCLFLSLEYSVNVWPNVFGTPCIMMAETTVSQATKQRNIEIMS